MHNDRLICHSTGGGWGRGGLMRFYWRECARRGGARLENIGGRGGHIKLIRR